MSDQWQLRQVVGLGFLRPTTIFLSPCDFIDLKKLGFGYDQ